MIIHSKVKDYFVEIVNDILNKKEKILSTLQYKYNRLFYFVDENVYRIYEKSLKNFIGNDYFLVIEALEENKEYKNLANYYKELIINNFNRNDILITIGGGILQDISGFIASTLYRGIKWIFLPTTLLAQADSCIGSKTSINFENSKNMIGSFYPPDAVFIDIDFCKTLTNEYFNSGLGEIIKFHLMYDENKYRLLCKYLESDELRQGESFKEIIWSTLQIKKSYFEEDEFDKGKRNLLNYGHCFGHALESASNFAICHGEAVLIGMGFANLLSLKRGIMTKEKYDKFEKIFKKYYPRFDLSKVSIDKIISYLKQDKKRISEKITMILSKDIGKQLKFDDIKEEEIIKTFNDFIKTYKIN
jgi:3-dehydroquinate synthase